MTRYIGIIGYHLKHSISPLFQQAALDYYGLDIRYEVWDVERVEMAVERLCQSQIVGANVTVPYKEAIIPFLDSLEPKAREIGAVNTIAKESLADFGHPERSESRYVGISSPQLIGAPQNDISKQSLASESSADLNSRLSSKLIGYNTDAYGFLQALKLEAGFDPNGKVAVMLGAGGVARAVGFALVWDGIRSLTIFNRTLERATLLAEALRQQAKVGRTIAARRWRGDVMQEVLTSADLIVNCTTLGMRHSPGEGQSPIPAGLIPRGALVYDLVYNPVETPLIREASEVGARVLGGLSMLVYQGAASFELWTGKKASLDIMMQSARRALE